MTGKRCYAPNRTKAITQYRHNVWQAREGLPQNSVQAVVQTRDGYFSSICEGSGCIWTASPTQPALTLPLPVTLVTIRSLFPSLIRDVFKWLGCFSRLVCSVSAALTHHWCSCSAAPLLNTTFWPALPSPKSDKCAPVLFLLGTARLHWRGDDPIGMGPAER
jgi:hypothetical protein